MHTFIIFLKNVPARLFMVNKKKVQGGKINMADTLYLEFSEMAHGKPGCVVGDGWLLKGCINV